MKQLGNRISKINKTDAEAFSVNIRFSDGTQGWVSLKNLFEKPKGLCSQVLKGNLFELCFIDTGALAWPNGLELCPDSLRKMLQSQRKNRGSSA